MMLFVKLSEGISWNIEAQKGQQLHNQNRFNYLVGYLVNSAANLHILKLTTPPQFMLST